MAVQELFEDSRVGEFDGVNASTRRRFLVDATRETALLQPGVPKRGDQYDWNSAVLTCDRVSVSAVPNPTQCIVEALYSTNGRWTIPNQNDTQNPAYSNFSLTYQRSPVKIPIFRKTIYYAPSATGGPPAPAYTYERQDVEDNEAYFGTLRITLNRKSFSLAERTIINAQRGRIHRFTAATIERWKFLGADVSSSTPGQWKYDYTWIGDPGTQPVVGDPDNPPMPGDNIIGPNIVRPPFWRYFVYSLIGYDAPVIDVRPQFEDQENATLLGSWNQLPGNPIGVLT